MSKRRTGRWPGTGGRSAGAACRWTVTTPRPNASPPAGWPTRQSPAATAAPPPKPVRDRGKNGPTPKQARPATFKTSPLLPLRRQAPAPADFPEGATGQRPAGRTPQEAHPALQVPHTVTTTTPRRPHRVRAAILGRGFHRHVHATPITDRDGSAGEMPGLSRIAEETRDAVPVQPADA